MIPFLAAGLGFAGLAMICAALHQTGDAEEKASARPKRAGEAVVGENACFEGVGSTPKPVAQGEGFNGPALFWRRVTERLIVETYYDSNGYRQERRRWVPDTVEEAGAFILADDSGGLLVLPRGARLDFPAADVDAPDTAFASDGARRARLYQLSPGRVLCAMGTVIGPEAAIGRLAAEGGAGLPPEFLAAATERARRGELRCLAAEGDDEFWIADRPWDEVLRQRKSDAKWLGWLGAALMLVAAALGALQALHPR